MSSQTRWWEADEGEMHSGVFRYVAEVEAVQVDIFERMLRLAYLYDPNEHLGLRGDYYSHDRRSGVDGQVAENVVAQNIDTVTSHIATTEIRARFIPDDADWSTQRRAKHLEWYTEGLAKSLEVHPEAVKAFKDGALKGTGIVKVCTYEGEIRIERVLPDDIVVDEGEARMGRPRQMHQRIIVGAEVLKARFPGFEDEIDAAKDQGGDAGGSESRLWAGYRPIEDSQVVAIESWVLPVGKPGQKGHRPGKHTICIEGADLVDEEWKKDHFPFARFAWVERNTGWYGISLAERIAGHQRALNKLNWQIDRQLDQIAVPTTYVRLADANLAVKSTSRAGTIVPYKADLPHTIIPNAVSGETYQRRNDIKESSFEEGGLSRLAATSRKPAGVDSGVALREYRDQTTQRFAQQEVAFEKFVLRVLWLAIECAKDLGDSAPEVFRSTPFGRKRINWSDVDMGEVRLQMQAAGNLSRTPHGRAQLAVEWAEAGVISKDAALRLMRNLDVEREYSIYTAALENIEHCIEESLDGAVLVPEPYQNLKMGIWRFQQALLKAYNDGAPEEILENLRQWVVQAAHILSPPPDPTMTDAPMPGAADMSAPPIPGEEAAMSPAPLPAGEPVGLLPEMAPPPIPPQ